MSIRTLLLLIIVIGLTPDSIFAEVTRKTVHNPDGTKHVIFLSKGKEVAKEILDKNNTLIKTTGKIPDGTVKEYYGNGKLKAEWNYKNSKLEGINKEYYENGKLKAEWNYKNSKLEGIGKEYHENGKLKAEWNYKNGKLEGISTQYHMGGAILAKRNFKDGKPEGITKMYQESGELLAELNYKSGIMDGTSKVYYKNGKLRSTETYENGQVLNRKAYNSNGELNHEDNPPLQDKDKKSKIN